MEHVWTFVVVICFIVGGLVLTLSCPANREGFEDDVDAPVTTKKKRNPLKKVKRGVEKTFKKAFITVFAQNLARTGRF
jgi:hypothetical protein